MWFSLPLWGSKRCAVRDAAVGVEEDRHGYERFRGRIGPDARDSIPDRSAYQPPQAPEAAPNILYIVWDDIGFGRYGRVAVGSCG